MSRDMCLFQEDMVCRKDFAGYEGECEECQYFNGGVVHPIWKDFMKDDEEQESIEEHKQRRYLEALEWWDKLVRIEKIGVYNVIKDLQEGK